MAFAPYECEVCKGRFVFKKSFERHLLVIHELIPPETEISEKTFEDGSSIGKSKNVSRASKSFFECKLCGKVSNVLANLRQHLISRHGDDPPEFIRQLTKTEYEEKLQLEKEKPCGKCCFENCDFVAANQAGVSYHLVKMHNILKTETYKYIQAVSREEFDKANEFFTCEFCKKKFTQRAYLAKHRTAVHGNFDPEIAKFECSDCKVCFYIINS